MTTDLAPHIGEIARLILGQPNQKQSTRSQLRFGRNGSLAIELTGPDAGSWFDFEEQVGGGPWELLRLKAGLSDDAIPDWLDRHGFGRRNGNGAGHSGSTIAATYPYVGRAGKLLFEVVRMVPKTFRQRRPDGVGGWLWNLDGVSRVPYRLPELLGAALETTIWVVEGEKDVERLREWGLVATTCPGGAGKWCQAYNGYFAGRRVAILPDNDDAGRRHAQDIARHLVGIAADVRILELQGLPDKGDISDWITAGGLQSDLETLLEVTDPYVADAGPDAADNAGPAEASATLDVHDAGDIDVTRIPPRRWLLGVSFCRTFISGLIGTGAAGKTSVRYAQYLALASATPLTGEPVHRRARVLIACLEDDVPEVQRRIGAAMLYHDIDPEGVRGWLLYACPKGLKLLQTDARGHRAVGKLYAELERLIPELGIDLVSIDPFVKAHGVEENDNGAIDQVCDELTGLASRFDIGVDLISHARKGGVTPGDAESDRGASSKKDAGRLMRTLAPMSEAEASTFGMEAQERVGLVRVDDAKVNLTARSDHAMWFRLVGVPLHNGTAEYPSGDTVQTVERWDPPDNFAGVSSAVWNTIIDEIDAGMPHGVRYSDAARATDRAAWRVVVKHLDRTEAQAKQIIATWVRNGVLISETYHDATERKERKGLWANPAKRPG